MQTESKFKFSKSYTDDKPETSAFDCASSSIASTGP